MLKRVLYVEDEPCVQEIAKIALEHVGGYDVRICSSGQDALATVVGFAPQIILLDVMMPGMDGMQIYVALRKLPEMNTVPIVFLTAKSLPEELEILKALGASGIISKPFDPITLPDEVRAYWQKHESNLLS